MIVKGGNIEKKRNNASKIIGGVLSLSTAGEEGLTLPSAYDCPECNGQGSRSYERSRHEPYRRERTPVHDRLGKRVSVHDRLGGRTMLRDSIGRRVPVHDRLEQVADDRVQDDQLMRRDPEHESDRTDQSQWCPGGLTKAQK